MARTQTRGPITDYFGEGTEVQGEVPDGAGGFKPGTYRLALCKCVHGKEWPEGGEGCQECIVASMAAFHASLA